MSPRMVPLTVCARREYIAASTRLVHITTRNMFLPTDVFSILFCRCGVIYVTSISDPPVEMTFRCYFCNLSAKRGEVTDKEAIRGQSAAQVDNTEHCYHTRFGKVKSP